MFKIFETDEFIDCLSTQKQMNTKLQEYVYPQIKQQPFFGKNIKKLKDYTPDTWRYRVGDYRFFYTINQKEKIIFMLTIAHRKESYR